MKKLLLSALCLAGVASIASATETTLDVNNATNFQGTLVEERPAGTNGDTDNGQAKHYQPVNSLEIDGYSFSFTKGGAFSDPAYYWAMSNAAPEKQQQTIRLYGKTGTDGNTMTITAPAGVTFGSIEFAGSNGKAGGTVNASVGEAKMTAASAMTWTNNEAVSSVTLTFQQNFRITKMVVKSETGDVEPIEPVTGATFTKATTFESGKYIFVVDGKIACPIRESYSYGQMFLDVEAVMNGDIITYNEEDAMTITVDNGQATMMDKYNRYYGMDDSHFTSFQLYTELNDGCYWTAAFEGDNIRLTSTKNTDCFVAQNWNSKNDTFYNNIAPGKNTDPAQFKLPVAYKLQQSGVAAVEADVDANAPVVYYNLQGQRVANPENGLYIRVQGNKVEKVAIR